MKDTAIPSIQKSIFSWEKFSKIIIVQEFLK